MYEKFSNKVLYLKFSKSSGKIRLYSPFLIIFLIETIFSESNYQLITIQVDTVSYSILGTSSGEQH